VSIPITPTMQGGPTCGPLPNSTGSTVLGVIAIIASINGGIPFTFGAVCPAAADVPQAVLNPATLAQSFWQTIPLPVARPTVPPGWAITGKPAYLVTGGATRPAAFTEATPLGELSVQATGRYWVNWGQGGGWSGPYAGEGRAWPNGTISYVYDNVGSVTITVRETWTATWSLGGAAGTLGGLQTTATIPAFPIRQVQPVLQN
jgi:hypothetical protein